MAELTNHVQRTSCITSLTDKHYSLYHLKMTSAQVVETVVTNNSSFQNYPHTDNHIMRNTTLEQIQTEITFGFIDKIDVSFVLFNTPCLEFKSQ